jgi:hypothetical protein
LYLCLAMGINNPPNRNRQHRRTPNKASPIHQIRRQVFTMLAVTIWWVVDAHRWFKGPVVNVEHAIHGIEHEQFIRSGVRFLPVTLGKHKIGTMKNTNTTPAPPIYI